MTERIKEPDLTRGVVITHAGAIITVGLVVLFLELFGNPVRRGFFCDDEAIQYPLLSNTVSEGILILAALGVPFIIIIVTEFWRSYNACESRVQIWWVSSPVWITRSLKTCGYFAAGTGLCQIINSAGKFTIGRLRPHFLAVCKPENVCDSSTPHGYVVDYQCTGAPMAVIEARLSFPSGHASMAFFACVYLIIYLQNSSKWLQHGFLRCTLQFLFILATWWISLTRVMDNWHHWSDVFAGAILGTIAGYIAAMYLPGIDHTLQKSLDEFVPLQSVSTTQPTSTSSSN